VLLKLAVVLGVNEFLVQPSQLLVAGPPRCALALVPDHPDELLQAERIDVVVAAAMSAPHSLHVRSLGCSAE